MKNALLLGLILFAQNTISAQEEADIASNDSIYNRWSIETNVGLNKPITPFSNGYYSSNNNDTYKINKINHFDFGVRYMLSYTFGFKIDYAHDKFENISGGNSLPFKTESNRLALQGVINLGRLARFESFTSRFGMLAHAGIQASLFEPKSGVNSGVTEKDAGIIFGITPQFRISNRIVFSSDFSLINNIRQHFNWDGTASSKENNLTGKLFIISAGLTFYLGRQEKHADWAVFDNTANKKDKEARERLDLIETQMNDTDRDGVVDYLDLENNTPNGVTVDSRGKFIDKNNNGVPDEMEPKDTFISSGTNGTNSSYEKADVAAELIKGGYINIFFELGKDTPAESSMGNLYYIIRFLRSHPDAKIVLTGFADATGDENLNMELSKRRANKVQDIIIASGIDAGRIAIEGQGVDVSYPKDAAMGLARRVSVRIE